MEKLCNVYAYITVDFETISEAEDFYYSACNLQSPHSRVIDEIINDSIQSEYRHFFNHIASNTFSDIKERIDKTKQNLQFYQSDDYRKQIIQKISQDLSAFTFYQPKQENDFYIVGIEIDHQQFFEFENSQEVIKSYIDLLKSYLQKIQISIDDYEPEITEFEIETIQNDHEPEYEYDGIEII